VPLGQWSSLAARTGFAYATRETDRGKAQHILDSVRWIGGALTKVTEGDFRIDDRAFAASDWVNLFVTSGDVLEIVRHLLQQI
jgi:hypothetical protein